MKEPTLEAKKEAYEKPELTKGGRLKDVTAGVPGTFK